MVDLTTTAAAENIYRASRLHAETENSSYTQPFPVVRRSFYRNIWKPRRRVNYSVGYIWN